MRAIVARLFAGTVFAFAAGCDSSTGSDGSFSISLSEQTTSVAQGTTKAITVTITRAGFDEPVSFTVDGLPTGVSASFSPSPSTGASSILQLTAAGTVPPGTSTLTVRATGDGATEQTATLGLTVTVTGTFTLGTLESDVTVAQGGGGYGSVLVNRIGGFGGVVSVAVSGAPAGLTVTASAPTASNSVSLTLAAGGSVAPGSYTLTLTGSSSGLGDQQTTLPVTVIAAPATAPLTLAYCSGSLPIWLAYRNTGSAWQVATLSGNSYTFQATDRLAVAVVFVAGANKRTDVYHALRSELAAQQGRDCGGTKSVTGSVSGMAAAQQARIAMGTSVMNPAPTSSSPNYTLASLADRPLDLVATQGIAGGSAFTPDKMIIRRALNPASGAVLPVLDFASGEAFSPQLSTVTINNVSGADEKLLINTFWSATSTYGALQVTTPAVGSAVFYSVPAAQQVASDLHELYLDAYQGSLLVGRTLTVYYATPGDRTETIGPFLSVPVMTTLARTPYARVRARLDLQAEYNGAVRFGFYQEPGGASDTRLVYLQATAGYFGGAPAVWDVSVPDFTGVAGFSNAWMLAPGVTTGWLALGYGGRVDLLHDARPDAGDFLRHSDREGVIAGGNLLVLGGSTPFGNRRAPAGQYFRR